MKLLTPETAREAAKIRVRNRAKAVADQELRTSIVDGYTIRPAIGQTGGVDNVGWELIPPGDCGAEWYLATYEQCKAAIPRHQKRYGTPKQRKLIEN